MVCSDCVWLGYIVWQYWRLWRLFCAEHFDVAALNTTHHFNYLFGHKTVEVEGGATVRGRNGQLSAQFSLAGGSESLNLTNCQRFLSRSKPTADQPNPTRLFPVLFGPAHRLFSLYSLVLFWTGEFIYDQRPRDTVFLVSVFGFGHNA